MVGTEQGEWLARPQLAPPAPTSLTTARDHRWRGPSILLGQGRKQGHMEIGKPVGGSRSTFWKSLYPLGFPSDKSDSPSSTIPSPPFCILAAGRTPIASHTRPRKTRARLPVLCPRGPTLAGCPCPLGHLRTLRLAFRERRPHQVGGSKRRLFIKNKGRLFIYL